MAPRIHRVKGVQYGGRAAGGFDMVLYGSLAAFATGPLAYQLISGGRDADGMGAAERWFGGICLGIVCLVGVLAVIHVLIGKGHLVWVHRERRQVIIARRVVLTSREAAQRLIDRYAARGVPVLTIDFLTGRVKPIGSRQ